jgi:glycosyltransferase involved in cell wall biosynthesis
MKILVDGYWWHEGPHSNRMVLLEIVKHWMRFFPDDELLVAVPKGRKGVGLHRPPVGVSAVTTHMRTHPAINSIELPMIARRESADAILAFNFAAMSKRAAVFLHDVLFQTNPEWFTPLERLYYSAMPILAHRARTVITTSANECSRISENNPRLQRVVNCGLAASSSLTDAEPQRVGLDISTDRFILCVGRFNVRKNLEVTVRALRQSGLLSESFPLVVVGEPSGVPADISEFAEAIANKSIVIAQSVTDEELSWLYSNCRLFVCLALDEGFGLPVVEAATFGAPILASDIPVFRETLGSYGTFVRPTDTEAIAATARRLVTIDRDSGSYVARYTWRLVCERIRDELGRL